MPTLIAMLPPKEWFACSNEQIRAGIKDGSREAKRAANEFQSGKWATLNFAIDCAKIGRFAPTMRRYTRLPNGFSRKLENHAAATALNYFAYDFIKIHRTLRMSPAMAAGVETRLWSVEDLVPSGKPMNSGGWEERRD
jgi:hypothetical protein